MKVHVQVFPLAAILGTVPSAPAATKLFRDDFQSRDREKWQSLAQGNEPEKSVPTLEKRTPRYPIERKTMNGSRAEFYLPLQCHLEKSGMGCQSP